MSRNALTTNLVVRPDLVFVRYTDGDGLPTGQTLVQDPVSDRFWMINDFETHLLSWLREPLSLPELQTRLEARFPPKRVSVRQLHRVLGSLHRSGLLKSGQPNQADEAIRRQDQRELWQTVVRFNPLMMRLPGINASSFFAFLNRLACRLIHPTSITLSMLFASCVALLVACSGQQLREDSPSWETALSWQTVPYLLISLGLGKVVHEIGHAIMAARFGIPCREIGLGFFFFAPCLYTDTTDCWQLTERWKRIAVASAGVLAEYFVASLVAFAWWAAEPGALRQQMFYFVLTSTVFTTIVNLNPLLRYDGYYILVDLLGEPNLHARSAKRLSSFVKESVFGLKTLRQTHTQRPALLVGYAICSLLYRFAILSFAFVFVFQMFSAADLPGAGILLILVTAGLLLIPAFRSSWRWLRNPDRRCPSLARMLFVGAAFCLLITLVGTARIPHYRQFQGTIRPTAETTVFATASGSMREVIRRVGDEVSKGETIATLCNPDLRSRELELSQAIERAQTNLDLLANRRTRGPVLDLRVEAARARHAELADRFQSLQRELSALVITAPEDGVVFQSRSEHSSPNDATLVPSDLSVLSPFNQRAWIETGTEVCRIGTPRLSTVRCEVDEHVIRDLEPGQKARILIPTTTMNAGLGSFSTRLPDATVIKCSGYPVEPESVARDRVSVPGQPGRGPSYEVILRVTTPIPRQLDGLSCPIRVRCGSLSVFQRLERFFAQLFGQSNGFSAISRTSN